MKKVLSLLVGVCLLLSMAGCTMHAQARKQAATAIGDILLLADAAELQGPSGPQIVWETLSHYAQERGVTVRQAVSSDATPAQRLQTLDQALNGSVSLVVCVGERYEETVFEAQRRYPDLLFLLLDGEPRRTDDAVYETTANTHCILFDETQAGFLAGYAAVMEGGRRLGICGGSNGAGMVRYAYGFMQGADVAAGRLRLGSDAIMIRCHYAESEENAKDVEQRLTDWFSDGVQTIFVSDNGSNVLTAAALRAAAVKENTRVVAADIPRTSDGERLLTTAVKAYDVALLGALTSLEENAGRWNADRAGRSMRLGVAEEAVGLDSLQQMKTFTSADYAGLLGELKAGTLAPDPSSLREVLPALSHCSVQLTN